MCNRATSSSPLSYFFFLVYDLKTGFYSLLGTAYSIPSLVPFRKERNCMGSLLFLSREHVPSLLLNRRKQNHTAYKFVCDTTQRALPVSDCHSVLWVSWPLGSRHLCLQCSLLLPLHTFQNTGEMSPLRWSRGEQHQHIIAQTQAVYPCQSRWLDFPLQSSPSFPFTFSYQGARETETEVMS